LFIVPPRAQASRGSCDNKPRKAASPLPRQAPLAVRSLDPFRALRELVAVDGDEERLYPLRLK